MATLLEKVQILVSANLHQLVDQALQSNSVAVYNYYIREIENNLDKLEDAVATVGGQVKTIRRKRDEYQAQADRLALAFAAAGKGHQLLAPRRQLHPRGRRSSRPDSEATALPGSRSI